MPEIKEGHIYKENYKILNISTQLVLKRKATKSDMPLSEEFSGDTFLYHQYIRFAILMQRGLQMIFTSVELWKEYFKLELSYVNKIKAYCAIISIDPRKEKKRKKGYNNNHGNDNDDGDYTGITKDAKGLQWTIKSALAGNFDATCNVGYYDDNYRGIDNKEGFKWNHKKAFKWFKKAAENYYIDSQYKLGKILYKGYGTKKDIIKAIY
ncbi:hypothetical protein Glove_5g7 [Diversispora epigaea]|uniref:Uncharacterized protein n=1 Tax=Diversispora epigaea TaxID=1348612 RepID=A0A397JPB3_9GLOM|nr:hypothetical protein Glove_5g7 [Diversispora epigaea]